MSDEQKTLDAWNNVVSTYETQFMDLELYNESYDLFLGELEKDGAEVLEIACGPGNISRYMMQQRPSMHLTGIDWSPYMIERARINVPKAEFKEMDCRSVLSLDSSFDAIVCGFAIPYLSRKEREKLLSDCSKLLSLKGIFYLSFVSAEIEKTTKIKDQKGNEMRFYFHNTVETVQDLTSNSFELLHEILIPYQRKDGSYEAHTILIAKRA